MLCYAFFFFFNDTATTEIYTLSLHDALPISDSCAGSGSAPQSRCRIFRAGGCTRPRQPKSSCRRPPASRPRGRRRSTTDRSEEHTSELQSRQYLVCRLLLEKKKNQNKHTL